MSILSMRVDECCSCTETVPLAPADKSRLFSVSSPMIWMFCLGLACLDDQHLSLAYFWSYA